MFIGFEKTIYGSTGNRYPYKYSPERYCGQDEQRRSFDCKGKSGILDSLYSEKFDYESGESIGALNERY